MVYNRIIMNHLAKKALLETKTLKRATFYLFLNFRKM